MPFRTGGYVFQLIWPCTLFREGVFPLRDFGYLDSLSLEAGLSDCVTRTWIRQVRLRAQYSDTQVASN